MNFGLEQHIIDTFIEVFEANSKVDKAYVFGSRAKGNYRPDSDIDIAIKGQDLSTDDIISMSVAFETKGITHKFDLIDYNNIKEPALKEHIDRVGIEFYSRWKKVILQDVVSKLGDGLHGTPEYDINGEYYFINGNNLIDGKIVIKEITQRVTENEYLKYKKELNNRTILLGINGTIGNVALYNGEKCVLGKSACYFNVIDTVNKDYVKYVITDKTFQSYIENFANGSTIMNVSLKVIREYEFSLPPIKEQTAIASILSSLDDKIDLLQRQNKTVEQLVETLFRQWFLEEAEESWEIVKIGQFVKTNQRSISKDYPFKEIEYLDTSSITKGIITETQKITMKDAPSRAKRLVKNDDILISTVRPDQKHYGIINNPIENLVVSTGFCVINCTEINPHFIYLLLTSNEMTQYLHSIAEGSTSTYPSLKPSDIEKIEFLKPPENKLNEFGNVASDFWTKINNNQTQIRTLMQTRDNLLPKLMSGEVKVSELN